MEKETYGGERAYMERALQLSLMGAPNVSPNPMVGAVIVARGRIIGEGYHRLYGGPHAEVNAVASVRESDRPLLREATMYVTLEPCSHYGMTPPCADLVVSTGIPRVVVAHEDPFLRDYESGIEKMRKAGVEVETGMMRREAWMVNRRFFTAHTLKRPYVLLKWAQSADGFIAAKGPEGMRPVKISTPLTAVLAHRERALYDAIMTGTDTILTDNPRLDCRLWPCRNPEERPLKATFDSVRLAPDSERRKSFVLKEKDETLSDFLHRLYRDFKVTSLMVEGGTKTLESFIREALYDEVRIETSADNLGDGVAAPKTEGLHLRTISTETYGKNTIRYLLKPVNK